MAEAKTVSVLYKYADGAHFFVSDDEDTLGLCVAHTDPATAFAAVSATLEKLFKENHGENVRFTPALSIHAFQRWIADRTAEAVSRPAPGTAGTFAWDPEPAFA